MNEILLISSVIFIYGMALVGYKFFGKTGLYCLSAVATILANVEVILLINAFGMEQTLGNVLFAVTFLITDILSECEGKKAANKAVFVGIFSSIFFFDFITKLVAIYSKCKRYYDGFCKISFRKHSKNDYFITSCLCNKPVL